MSFVVYKQIMTTWKQMEQTKNDKSKLTPTAKKSWGFPALLGAFIVVAGITAVLTFIAVRDFVVSWNMGRQQGLNIEAQQTRIPGITDELDFDSDTPLQPAIGPEPQPWDGASRVTILFLGTDYRDYEEGQYAPRSDTMILFSVDPLTRTAGMLSIPRDLWVNIPGGFEPARINMATRYGEIYRLPGGGPGLAMRTVENLLGIPIDYYVMLDFYTFERFIDEIHGVKLVIPEEIRVDPLGQGNAKILQPGEQVLPGDLALAYARARNTPGGDFDRAQRQHQIVMGVYRRILEFEMLPTLITKAPSLYQELSAGVKTNLTLLQVIQLAWLGQQIPEENIKRGIINSEHVVMATSPDGASVLKPRPEQIRRLRDEIFTSEGPVSPVVVDADAQELMQAEAALVSVLNGTSTPGLASRTADFLKELGVSVNSDNAPEFYASTTLIDYTGNPYTLNYLVDLMDINANRIYHRYDPTSETDVVLILGNDWANSNPLPP
jgi:polyisoprenyl-teichoic acid--peptidoglycan teichoic acid transferase